MEIATGLIETRGGGGVELIVRCVNDRTCFVALPKHVVAALTNARSTIPLPLAVSSRVNKGSHGTRNGTTHRPTTPTFTAWAGAVGADDCLEVPLALADCLGLVDGQPVVVVGRPTAPVATAVDVSPETESDWSQVLQCANELEQTALRQIGVCAEGQLFPFWSSSQNGPLRLRATKVLPNGNGSVARLGLETELRVAPWVAQSGPTGNTSARTTGADVPATNQTAPQTPAMLRVQSDRRVVVAWPRRLRGFVHDDFSIHAAPTTAAFISKRTSEDLGLGDGCIVAVRGVDASLTNTIVSGNETNSPSAPDTSTVALRVVVTGENRSVADGHVVLTPSVRDALALVQGSRVMVVETASGTSSNTVDEQKGGSKGDKKNSVDQQKTLLRLRPVLSKVQSKPPGSSNQTSDTDDVQTYLSALEQGHRQALGIHSISDCTAESLDQTLVAFVKSWVETQAKFYGPSSDGRNDSELFVPVVTGTELTLRCSGDEKTSSFSVSFTLETRSAVGDAPVVLLDPSHSIAQLTNSNRIELGPACSLTERKSKDISPAGRSHSKLFGDAIFVDLPLGSVDDNDGVDSTSRDDSLGQAVVTEIESATRRLAATLGSRTSRHQRPSTAGVLLWGPPGCGRTDAAHAVARRLRDDTNVCACVVTVDCAKIPVGDPRPAIAALRHVAKAARKLSPAVVVLDDLDVLAGADTTDTGNENQVTHAMIVGEALGDLIDATAGEGMVAWIATARSPARVSKPVLVAGRLDHLGELTAPDANDGRAQRLQATATQRGTPVANDVNLQTITKNTDGFARRDLDLLVERAAAAAAARQFAGDEQLPGNLEKLTATLETSDLLHAKRGFTAAPDRALGKCGQNDDATDSDKNESGIVTLKSVGGLLCAKKALDEALSFPLRYSEIFSQAPLRLRTGALLYGPPGCGKTLLAHAAVKGAGLRLIAVKGPELLNKYIGQSEASVREVFARAQNAKPCCLFFDEFDSIAPRRGHDTTGVTDRVVNAFLTELDGVEGLEGVVVLAATSRPDLIDPALLRPGRLDRTLLCPFPDEKERREILETRMDVEGSIDTSSEAQKKEKQEDPLGLDEVACRTDGFSGADLVAIISDAARIAEKRDGVAAETTRDDVLAALSNARASVSTHERARLEHIYAAFRGDSVVNKGKGVVRTTHA